MYPAAVVAAARERSARGESASNIALALGIPKATVRYWLTARSRPERYRVRCSPGACELVQQAPPEYGYLLGLYLGDGYIASMANGVGRLSISCCDEYPGLLNRCASAMMSVLPHNRVIKVPAEGCTSVAVYSKHIRCLFPQAGIGPKHLRRIVLEDWQAVLAERHPELLLAGLIHSDGCRVENRVRAGGRTYSYGRYFFSNRSADILGIFTDACDLLRVQWRMNQPWSVSVARRGSVALLDALIPPKQ